MSVGSYDYDGLIRSFLRQDQPSATTAGDRMSYFGIELYSYNSVLARLDLTNEILCINKCIAKYSNTTAKQTNRLREINHFRTFTYDITVSPEDAVMDEWNDLEYLITKIKRAKSRKQDYIDEARTKYDSTLALIDYLNIDKQSEAATYNVTLFTLLFEHGVIRN